MKKTLLILIMLTPVFALRAQQSLTLYNMDVIGQSTQVNPSLMPENNMYFGIPVLGSTTFLFTNSAFTWRNLHRVRPDDSVNIEIEDVINNLPDKNFISLNLRMNLVEAGFKVKNNYFSINVAEKGIFNLTFPKELFELVFRGNGAFIGQEIDLRRMSFDATHYREYAIGWTRAVNKKVTIGGRLKYLYGMENFSSGKSNLTFYTAPDDYRLELTSDYVINTSSMANEGDGKSGSYLFGLKNTGLAGDMSMTYFYSPRLTLNASIIDLGYINWKSNVKNYVTASGSYSFDGVDINDFMSDDASGMDNVTDSLSDSFSPDENQNPYKTYIPAHAYFNASYKLTEKTKLNGLVHAQIFRQTVQPTFTASLNSRLTDHFSASINYSVINHSFANVGGGIAFNVAAFQFYLMSDNWLGTINPLSYNTAHFQFGFNLIYGRQKTKKPQDYGVHNKTIKTNTNGSIMSEPIEVVPPEEQKKEK